MVMGMSADLILRGNGNGNGKEEGEGQGDKLNFHIFYSLGWLGISGLAAR